MVKFKTATACVAFALMCVLSGCRDTIIHGTKGVNYTVQAGSGDPIVAKGAVLTEKRNLANISAIEVHSGIAVKYVQSAQKKIVVEAPENIVPIIKTEVQEETLKIYPSSGFTHTGDITLLVTVYAPSVTDFEASAGSMLTIATPYDAGGAKVEIEATSGALVSVGSVKAQKLHVETSSGASMSIEGINAAKLEADATSGSSLKLAGQAAKAVLEASSAASLNAKKLTVNTFTAEHSSAATISKPNKK